EPCGPRHRSAADARSQSRASHVLVAGTYRDPFRRRPLQGLDRTYRPAVRGSSDARALACAADRHAPAGDGCSSRSHGPHHAWARACNQPVPRRASLRTAGAGCPHRAGRAGAGRGRQLSDAARIKAPRGTFDVLGEQSSVRHVLEAKARAILESAGCERIETPAFEATELFARGVGASTDIVQKEMYTFADASGRSLTLRPEGTAPVCRAYVEHGMHKLRQPVKLWYLSTFFRHERAQAGRYRQFWQVGAEALGSDDPALDAESVVLLSALLADARVREGRLRLSSLGNAETRGAYRELLQSHLRANEESLSRDVRDRID